MEKTIKLAGIPIGISSLYDSLPNAKEFETAEEPAFTVRVSNKEIVAEQAKVLREATYEKRIPCPQYSLEELENTAIYRKIAEILPHYNGLVFHGSAVAVGEKAYLFTAKSGTGKTTHSRLWLKNIPGSYIVNGDKPVLRLIDGKPFVCGTPWMGKEHYGCSKNVPLAAVCFLNRGEENRIKKASFSSVLPQLIGQAYRPPDAELLTKTIRIMEKMGEGVSFYELYCNMSDEAAKLSYAIMSKK